MHKASTIAFDVGAGMLVVGSLLQWLPPLASLVGIIYYILQIYAWFKDRKEKK